MTGPASPTLQQVDDGMNWYGGKSQSAQTQFEGKKIMRLTTAGIIRLREIFNIPSRIICFARRARLLPASFRAEG
jgi:hypothetical protein